MTHVQPGITVLLLLLAFGMIPGVARSRRGRSFPVLAALIGLFLWSFAPVAQSHAWLLERWYPAGELPSQDAEVIVVLAGGMRSPDASQREALVGRSTYLRTRHAAWLHRNWKAVPVVAAGGAVGRYPSDPTVSALMAEILIARGVPEAMVRVESGSLSTHENAVNTVKMLREMGYSKALLVTGGVHMFRAELCFRKQGIEVVSAPCAYRSVGTLDRWQDFVPEAESIRTNEACLHEWIALAWYWWKGWI